MRAELLPGMSNVVRFPVERRARPTLGLLRELAPDVREVLAIAEAFDLVPPPADLRAQVDEATAEHILNCVDAGPEMSAALDGLLHPVMERAVSACRAAHDASLDARAAQEALLSAELAGHVWIDHLRDRATTLVRRAAGLLLDAHASVEQAEGVARAASLAARGETWAPRDLRADEVMLFGAARRAAR